MIYTLTISPAVDYYVDVNNFKIGEINRTENEIYMPGGKGINVSYVLSNLGMQSVALGFVAGFSGAFIKDELNKKNINTDFVDVDGITRINVKIRGSVETAINGMGPTIKDEDVNKLLNKMSNLCDKDYFVVSGKIPSCISHENYIKILSLVKERGAKLIVDTQGKTLLDSLLFNPFIIKPNKEELEDLFNVSIKTKEDVISYSKKLIEDGAQNVIVSLGKDGAILVNKDTIKEVQAIEGVVKNSVGAGDSLLAGFIFEYINSSDLEKALKFSVAAGSASAFLDDLATKEDIYNCFNNMR